MEFGSVIARRRSVREFADCSIDDAALLRIVDAGRLAPSGCNRQNREFVIVRDRSTLAELDRLVQPVFARAAAAIAVVVDPSPTPWGEYWIEDAAAAAENMHLAAVNEGYCSVWVEGTLLRVEDQAKALLGVPDGRRLYVLLPIGRNAESGNMAPKAALADIVHYETYGNREAGG